MQPNQAGDANAAGAAQAATRRRQCGAAERRRERGGVFGNFVAAGDGAIEPLGSEAQLKRRFLGFNMTGGFIDTAGDGGAQDFPQPPAPARRPRRD